MPGKLMLLIGVGVGYIIGVRTGRAGYEKIKKQATDAWNSPRVQKTVSDVGDFAKDKFPTATEKVTDVVDKVSAATKLPPQPAA
ncbi:MAG: YtxH protein [Microbacteriaceae bacterium]|nr:YtxH protein [Microbacteriaceae bacterium]